MVTRNRFIDKFNCHCSMIFRRYLSKNIYEIYTCQQIIGVRHQPLSIFDGAKVSRTARISMISIVITPSSKTGA
jgi:hypothetical protein